MQTSTRTILTEHELADTLGVSVHFLRRDRISDRKLPYFKIGKLVRYDLTRVRHALGAMEQGGAA